MLDVLSNLPYSKRCTFLLFFCKFVNAATPIDIHNFDERENFATQPQSRQPALSNLSDIGENPHTPHVLTSRLKGITTQISTRYSSFFNSLINVINRLDAWICSCYASLVVRFLFC